MMLEKLNSVLHRANQQKDLILVALFFMIVLMMVIPLPAIVMDIMIALNISFATVILLMSLHLKSPAQFSTFPSLLLTTTLFRLAISVSTTRLILVEGSAGKIVETFGKVVVSGNLVVGLVIFLIITVVQFLVITKGADRVAEVGARFTLDGMPGKQMAVDADVRAGITDQFGAKQARQALEKESKLFGAMDGAMKFVKGDAIAGLVITAINLIGGIGIGIGQKAMSFSEALALYSLMTIGDGLVAQIPALLISVAAGTIVTRVTSPESADLGSEISEQLTSNPRTVLSAGLVIIAFGFVPGFPTIVFLFIGGLMFCGVLLKIRSSERLRLAAESDWVEFLKKNEKYCVDQSDRHGKLESIEIVFPTQIVNEPLEVLKSYLQTIENLLSKDWGVTFDHFKLSIGQNGRNDKYEIILKQSLKKSSSIHPGKVFVKANVSYLSSLGIPVETHCGVEEGSFVDEQYVNLLQAAEIGYYDLIALIMHDVVSVSVENMKYFGDFEATSRFLRQAEKNYESLVSDLRENLSTSQISSVLQLLLEERVGLANLSLILESMLKASSKQVDPYYLLQKVRISLSDQIVKKFSSEGVIPAVVVSPSLENVIREGLRQTDEDNFVILEPELSRHFAKEVERQTRSVSDGDPKTVLLAQQDVRRPIFDILNKQGLKLPVISYQELGSDTIIYPVGFVGTLEQPGPD
ncbi:FHIPEP family type III secretion protein [Ruegeria sp. SCPT10]|uniref:FHIPEP family type III secretion protein n=1 Tax=Ruegeria sp. SCP10 TaxID=3141377 RepID=UPI0033371F7C